VISAVHTALYRATRGRGLASLLPTTTGRRSGTQRTVTLTYVPDSNDYVVVASNGGADRHPAWLLNLQRTPPAIAQVGANLAPIVAHAAEPAECRRLWPKLIAANPFVTRYELLTERPIPVVILRPQARA
jgi:deazaflavin-dependent oxidoreductase (nitroreductase family)